MNRTINTSDATESALEYLARTKSVSKDALFNSIITDSLKDKLKEADDARLKELEKIMSSSELDTSARILKAKELLGVM